MKESQDQIEKVGQTLIYLREKIGFLSKTKALKLLYIIEEKAVERFGHQILDLEFEVWKHGPVDRELYVELSNDTPKLLADYISLEDFNEDKKKIEPKVEFNDDEFSQADLDLIDSVVEEYGRKTAKELVDLTHSKGSLWDRKASKHGKFFWFINTSTDERIDFSELIQGDEKKLSMFKEHNEHADFVSSLKTR